MRQPFGFGAQMEGQLRTRSRGSSTLHWTPDVEAEIRCLVTRWLSSHRALLETRMAEGHICDGHGDLQASDIYCLEDGIRILDCLEFSDRVALGRCLRRRCLLGDGPGAPGPSGRSQHVRQSLRAALRTSLAALALASSYWPPRVCEGEGRLPSLRAERLSISIRPALCRHWPSSTSGVPGRQSFLSGGSREPGRALSPLDSPPRMAGRSSAPTRSAGVESVGPDRYAPESRAAVYEEIFSSARERLAEGESVVLDASWISADERGSGCSGRRRRRKRAPLHSAASVTTRSEPTASRNASHAEMMSLRRRSTYEM